MVVEKKFSDEKMSNGHGRGHVMSEKANGDGGAGPGRGPFSPRLQAGPEQQAARNDDCADEKNMVKNEFHGDPMVEVNPRIIK